MVRCYEFMGRTLGADIEFAYAHILEKGEVTVDEIWEWEKENFRNKMIYAAFSRGKEIDVLSGVVV